MTCRCRDCGRDFYADAPGDEVMGEIIENDGMVDDEEALQAAEDELKREMDEHDDRRCK